MLGLFRKKPKTEVPPATIADTFLDFTKGVPQSVVYGIIGSLVISKAQMSIDGKVSTIFCDEEVNVYRVDFPDGSSVTLSPRTE